QAPLPRVRRRVLPRPCAAPAPRPGGPARQEDRPRPLRLRVEAAARERGGRRAGAPRGLSYAARMLVSLGSPRGDERDVVDALLACHERIRRFSAMAVRIADAGGATELEIRDAAAAVRRYFAEALPLHVADEDEDLAPLLAGRDPAIDAALATMSAE